MRFFTLATIALSTFTAALSFEFERLDKNNSALIILDHQVGLFHLVKDFTAAEYRNNILAHANLGKAFNLPVVMTSSSETGPNGPLPKEITDLYPDAPLVKRQGEVDAWDNEEFRKAVEATGKKQLIIAGITTDVCTAFLALSLRAAGYSVWANADASGTFNLETARDANDRMRSAGVNVVSNFVIATDLMRDWRSSPGAEELLPYFDTYLPSYGYLARAHRAAINNGTIFPGENL